VFLNHPGAEEVRLSSQNHPASEQKIKQESMEAALAGKRDLMDKAYTSS